MERAEDDLEAVWQVTVALDTYGRYSKPDEAKIWWIARQMSKCRPQGTRSEKINGHETCKRVSRHAVP